MTDRQIVELYLQRDEDALTISADLFSGYCKTVAMHFLRSAEDAEEVLNDTWLAACCLEFDSAAGTGKSQDLSWKTDTKYQSETAARR